MAFLLGEVSPERPGHDLQAGTGRDFPHSPERWAEREFPGYSGTDPGGIQLGRIPIGGIIWYFQSIR